MNRIKRFSLNLVVMVGMTLAMSSLGLAQQETNPDQFQEADEMSAAQSVAQQKKNDKVQLASSHRQSKTRKHKQLTKRNAARQQDVVIARK